MARHLQPVATVREVGPPLAGARGWTGGLGVAPSTLYAHRQSAEQDGVVLFLVCAMGMTAFMMRLWLVEGLADLALRCLPQLLLLLGVVAMAVLRRDSYVRRRELITAVVTLCANLTIRHIATHGNGCALFVLHGGSAARLAVATLLAGHGVWSCLFALYHGWSVGWARLALPATALVPLLMGDSMCHQLLRAPGVHAPLARLHTVLTWTHSIAMPPSGAALLAAPGVEEPLAQCLAVDGYLLLMAGLVVPLFVLARLKARRAAPLDAWPSASDLDSPAAAGGDGGEPGGGDEAPPDEPPALHDSALGHAWSLYMYSCVAWFAVVATRAAMDALLPAAR